MPLELMLLPPRAPHQHLSVRVVGARDDRPAPAADERSAGAPGPRRGAPSRAAPRAERARGTAQRDRSRVLRARRGAAPVPSPAVASAARSRPRGGGALGGQSPGSGWQLGRDPATHRVLAHGAARARLRSRSPGHPQGARRDARPLDDPPPRRQPPHPGMPLAGLGHRALGGRVTRVRRGSRRFRRSARDALAARGGSPRARRLVRVGSRRRAERLGVRVRERSLSRCRRHRGRAPRAPPRRRARRRYAAARARLDPGDAEQERRLGALSTRTTRRACLR